MIWSVVHVFLCTAVLLFSLETCKSEPQLPSLMLYSPGELEYTDVLVRRVHDNLTLVCEVHGVTVPRVFVWNYVSNGSDVGRPFTVLPSGPTPISQLQRQSLQLTDSGHYMCSSPPFSITKYILVQTRENSSCARGAFSCGTRCVLAAYVCDGRADCLNGEDESPEFCPESPCSRSDRLNCTTGRCIPEAACCRQTDVLCRQPSCCEEHPRYSRLEAGDVELEYPPLTDRHTPDDYGFIQSTIYTVTACALIFMIAVVLLVSALCKMHMKRAALRGYTHAHAHTARHYSARYPPRYEATRLLDQPSLSPTRQPMQCETESAISSPLCEAPETSSLSRLSSMFCTRYSQVPTQCDVEMTDVTSTSLNNSPTRTRPLDDYRSPIPNSDLYYTNPDLTNLGRDLNYMATPIEFFRRRTLRRNTLDRVIDHLTQTPRPLTLQLGRFQLSIPRLRRDRRPDTPNIAEINIENLDFVRLNSNETYTLNGRTIRLLGADFENYPTLDGNRPPPYNEAMRYKMYGPPPEYLSREGINRETEAASNVEMPPCYDDLNGNTSNARIDTINGNAQSANAHNVLNDGNVLNNNNILNNSNLGNNSNVVNDNNFEIARNVGIDSNVGNDNNVENNGNAQTCTIVNSDTLNSLNNNGTVVESISSVIDHLPAIDSDCAIDNSYNDNEIVA